MASEADNLQFMLQGLGIDCNSAPQQPQGLSRDSSDEHATEDFSTSGVSDSATDAGALGDLAERVLGYMSKSEIVTHETNASWDRVASDQTLQRSATAPQFFGGGEDMDAEMFQQLLSSSTQQQQHAMHQMLTELTQQYSNAPHGANGASSSLPKLDTVVPPSILNIPLLPNLDVLLQKKKEKERQLQQQEERRLERYAKQKEQAAAAAAAAAAAQPDGGSQDEDGDDVKEGGKKRRRRRRKPKKDRKDEAYWKNAPEAAQCMIVPVSEMDEQDDKPLSDRPRAADGELSADASPTPAGPSSADPGAAGSQGGRRRRGGQKSSVKDTTGRDKGLAGRRSEHSVGFVGLDDGPMSGAPLSGISLLPPEAFAPMATTGSELPFSLSVFNYANG